MSVSVALRHRFAGASFDIAFETPSTGVTVLFGPSGAGKSTVIAACAGLLRMDAGRVEVDGQVLSDNARGIWVPPERRRVGLVFQDARLFAHMSVEMNLRYGLNRAPAGPILFDDIVGLLGLAELLRRRPHTLSGGERQRVAIGRALLAQPRLLLMDEPLASLDAARKAEILPYIIKLKTALRLPVLYVTHSLEEMARLADTVVLLEAGLVVACGSLAEIAARGDLAVGQRDDAGAVLAARVAGQEPTRQLTRLDAGGATILVPLVDATVGQAVRIRIPAREVMLALTAPTAVSVQNVLPGVIRAITSHSARRACLVEVMLGEHAVLARVTPDAVERLGLVVGGRVFAMFKSVGIDVAPDE